VRAWSAELGDRDDEALGRVGHLVEPLHPGMLGPLG
jgi:hypothetical protein